MAWVVITALFVAMLGNQGGESGTEKNTNPRESNRRRMSHSE